MLEMVVAQTDEFDGEAAATAILEQCGRLLDGVVPDGGLLFANHELDLKIFLAALKRAYPSLALIGGTTVGTMSSAGGYGDGAASLSLFASDVVAFSTGVGTGVRRDVRRAAQEAVAEALGKTDKAPALCLTVTSVEGVDPVSITEALAKALGNDVVVFGGGATPDFPVLAPWFGGLQFHGERVLTDTLPILLISGPLKVSVGVAHGWTAWGRPATITKAEGDRILEIDGKPAAAYYHHYLGGATQAALANPLAILDPGSQRFYLRATTRFDEAGAVTIHGSAPEGAQVRIAMSNATDILQGASSSTRIALANYPAGNRPQGALVASCAVRNVLLGNLTASEIDAIRQELGPEVPVQGFYAYGEIAPFGTASQSQFHNQTCCTVLIGT